MKSQIVLLGAVASPAHTLEIVDVVSPATASWNNMVDVHIALAQLFAAPDTGVPPVVGFILLKPFVAVVCLFFCHRLSPFCRLSRVPFSHHMPFVP